MSKLLIALLALDIGVSLSKVFIFTWKSNYLIKESIFFLKEIVTVHFFYVLFYKINTKPIKELPTSSSTIKRAINFASPIKINPNSL